MKTRITVRAYDILWDVEGKRKPPQQVLVEMDLCDLEDNGRDYPFDELVREQVNNYINDKYLWASCEDYKWSFA